MGRFLFVILVVFFSSVFSGAFPAAAWAGGVDISGGGFGVPRGHWIFLQDLVEAGIEQPTRDLDPDSDFLKAEQQKLAAIFERDLKDFSWLDADTRVILANRLALIRFSADSTLASLIVQTMGFYNWTFVQRPLVPVVNPDPRLTDQYIQVAVRQRTLIYVNSAAWARMSALHRAALILHETLAALLLPARPESRVRQMVGALFLDSDSLPASTRSELQRSWPGYADFVAKLKIPGAPIVVTHALSQFCSVSVCGRDATYFTDRDIGLLALTDVLLFPSIKVDGQETYVSGKNIDTLTVDLCRAPADHVRVLEVYMHSLNLELLPDENQNPARLKVTLVQSKWPHMSLQIPAGTCRPENTWELNILRNWLTPEWEN